MRYNQSFRKVPRMDDLKMGEKMKITLPFESEVFFDHLLTLHLSEITKMQPQALEWAFALTLGSWRFAPLSIDLLLSFSLSRTFALSLSCSLAHQCLVPFDITNWNEGEKKKLIEVACVDSRELVEKEEKKKERKRRRWRKRENGNEVIL